MELWVLKFGEKMPPNPRGVLVLHETEWNDWWKYSTLYYCEYFDEFGESHPLGTVKIGQAGLQPAESGEPATRPNLPTRAVQFEVDTFSLGQSAEYYINANDLGVPLRDIIHKALRDIAFDLKICQAVVQEEVVWESLLREVPIRLVRGQLNRLAHGGTRLTEYDFTFVSKSQFSEPLRLTFSVRPESFPPTNIHAIIGRNGVGKSTLLNAMATQLVQGNDELGRFVGPSNQDFNDFNNLVSVSFSAFDDFEPAARDTDRREFGYSYIGSKTSSNYHDPFDSNPNQLDLLIEAVRACCFESRRERWINALQILESDPIFSQLDLASVASISHLEEIATRVESSYNRLSSGHKIVLISITRLVAAVEEKTLVLIDEPESHLHPPLLSAYIRALSELLINRNGVAIVATHSPVVLQELPATCVWKLSRVGYANAATRPDIETFGENVGTLTDEVFGLEVTATGFNKIIGEVAVDSSDYSEALDRFRGQLGLEGRSILRAKMLNRRRETS